MSERLDTCVAELYPLAAPGWYSVWQVAVLFGINDSSLRRHVEHGYFPGSRKNNQREWVIPRSAVITRLQDLERQDREEPAPKKKEERPKTYTLYRHWNDVGELLYVGRTTDLPRRTKSHQRQQPWWNMALHITMEHFETMTELINAEKAAIRSENPLWNKQRYKS